MKSRYLIISIISIFSLLIINTATIAQQCKSGINVVNGKNPFCNGDSTILYYGDTSSGKKLLYQWYRSHISVSNQINGAIKPTLVVNTADSFFVRVIDTTNPAKKDTGYCAIKIFVNPKPNATFTFSPTTACGTTTIQFTNTAAYNNSFQYDWFFNDPSGNNNQSNLQNPTHTYKPGTNTVNVNVQLIIRDNNGFCTDTVKNPLTITAGPDAQLDEITTSGVQIINGEPYFLNCSSTPYVFTFSNISTTTSINTNYTIDWGDGSTIFSSSTFSSNINHLYNVGLSTLTLTVSSSGCTNIKKYKIFVGDVPGGGLDPLSGATICSNNFYYIPLTKSVKNNAIGTIYILSVNDGTKKDTFYQPPPDTLSHFFTISSCNTTSTSGSTSYNNAFGAFLDIINPCGSGGSTSKVPIYVSGKPKANFIPSDTISCIGKTVTFSNTSIKGFDVSNLRCNSGLSVWKIFTAIGGSPYYTNNNLGNNQFTNVTRWVAGDDIINIRFDSVGVYTIKLYTASSQLCGTDSFYQTICVNATPTASFITSTDTICAGSNVSFTSTSNTPLCGSNMYSWSITPSNSTGCNAPVAPTFVNGTNASSQNPVLNFSQAGSYLVSLTTTISGTNCSSTAFIKKITVKDKPVVTVSTLPTSICEGATTTPTVSASCFTNNATYSWTFQNGNPATSNISNPGSITFNTAGTNNISVAVTNSCGTTSKQTSVNVLASPTLSATASNSTLCNGQTATINLTSNQNGVTYSWSSTVTSGIANGNSNQTYSITTSTISDLLYNTGTVDAVVTYTITVFGAAPSNCAGQSKTITITVHPGTTSPYAGLDQSLCNATSTTLAGNIPTVGTGTWTKILGGAATITNPNLNNTTVTGLQTGVYQFVWTITGSGGGACPNIPDTMQIVNRPAVTMANAGANMLICNFSASNNMVTLQGNTASPNRPFETGTWTLVSQPTNGNGLFSNVNSPTSTFSFNQPGNYILSWSITNDINCTPTSDTITVQVYEAAVAGTTAGSIAVCKNNNSGSINLSGYVGNIVKWQYQVLGSSIWVDVANTTSTLNYNNLDTTTIYRAIVSTTNTTDCPITATSTQSTITVNPVPVISNLLGVGPTQCNTANGAISFNVTPVIGNYTINYTLNGSNQTANINTTNGLITINNLGIGTYANFTVSLNNCTSNTLGSVTLSNPNKPATPIIVGNTPICSGNTLTLSATTTSSGTATFNWVFADGTSAVGAIQTINNINTSQSGIYHVTVSINQCQSNDTTINVLVNQTPNIPNTSPVTYCQNNTSLALTPSGSNFVWYTNATLTNGTTTAPIPNTTSVGSTTFYVIDSNTSSGCKSAAASLIVTVNPNPSISFGTKSNPSQCKATDGYITLNGLLVNTNYTVNYSLNGVLQPAVNVAAVSGIITLTGLSAGTYSNIHVILNNCPSNSIASVILSDPNPPAAPIIASVDSICSQQNLTLAASTTSTGSTQFFTWILPDGTTSTSNPLTINNIRTSFFSDSIRVNVTINNCTSENTAKVVRVDSTPVKPIITSNAPLCSDSTLVLTASTSLNTISWQWTKPNSTTSTVNPLTILNAQLVHAGNYIIQATSNKGCKSDTASIWTVINQTPRIHFLSDSNPVQCATATGYILIDSLLPNNSYNVFYNGQTAKVFSSDNMGVLKIDTLRQGTYNNIYVSTISAGCKSNVIGSFILTDPTPPATPTITSNSPICSDSTLTINAVTTSGVALYSWTGVNGFNNINQHISIPNSLTNLSGWYYVTATINQCVSAPDSIFIQVDSTPQMPIITYNAPLCVGSNLQLNANTLSSGGMKYYWVGANGFLSNTQNPSKNNISSSDAGIYSVRCISNIGNCPSKTASIFINVNATPNVNQLPNDTFKNNVVTGNISFSGTVANTVFNWVNNNPNIGLPQSGIGNINFTTTNTTPFAITGKITVTPQTDSCIGQPMTFYITVNPTPTLTSRLSDTICTSNTFTYQATTTTPGVKFTWSRATINGITNLASASTDSVGFIQEILFNTTQVPIPVIYNINLIAPDGSIHAQQVTVVVNPNAKSAITFVSDRICSPGIYDSLNIKPIIYTQADSLYQWYANNVLLGVGTGFPGYTISNPGDSILIKLVTTSSHGCKPDSATHQFYTVIKPTISFTKSASKGCGPLTVVFSNTSSPINQPTYFWDMGNGITASTINPQPITFLADTSPKHRDTTYYITLTAITQCDTIRYIDSVLVKPTPKALFQPDTTVGCSPFYFNAVNNSLGGPSTYYWSFGDGITSTDTTRNNASHLYHTAKTDTFTVKLVALNACGIDSFWVDLLVYPNTVFPRLIVNGQNTFGCAPQQIRIINNSSGGSKYTIDFGDKSPTYVTTKSLDTLTHLYTKAGKYVLRIDGTNGCSDTSTYLSLTLYPKPKALFSTLKNQYCVNENIVFNNLSDTGLQYYWDFGDGNTSINPQPNHKYAAVGKYLVKLLVSNFNLNGGVCTDTFTQYININPIPNAVIVSNSSNLNCQPFTFKSNLPSGLYASASWIFHNPYSTDTIRAGNNISYTFNNADTYTITLMVFNNFGCSDTTTQSIIVRPTPKAALFIPDSVYCGPLQTLNFTNQSTYLGTDAVNYNWFVNNNNVSSNANNLTYTFNKNIVNKYADTFYVQLTATSSYGCTNSIIKKITLLPKPITKFMVLSPDTVCAPSTISVVNQSLFSSGFTWFINGQVIQHNSNPSFIGIPSQNSTYTIMLKDTGCGIDSSIKVIHTYTNPISNFKLSDSVSCTGNLTTIGYDNSKPDIGTAISKWYWVWGDGSVSFQNPATHTYNTPGMYNVSLYVDDSRGCRSDTLTKKVILYGLPTANFTALNGCQNIPIIFTSLSKTGIGNNTFTYQAWNFGDGTYDTGLVVKHTYLNPGNYTVELTVLTDNNCVPVSIKKPIKISGKPNADFSFSDGCINSTIKFNNLTQPGNNETSFQVINWDFGDGIASNLISPSHVYNDTGKYKVELVVAGNDCSFLRDTVIKEIKIFQPRQGVTYPDKYVSFNLPVLLKAQQDGVNYVWFPIEGLVSPQSDTTTALYLNTFKNKYNYSITITDKNGCTTKDYQNVWVFVKPDIFVPTGFTPNGDGINDVLLPNYVSIQKLNSFRIFDRWGNKIFETNNMYQSWDGNINGAKAPMETYTWVVEGVSYNNEPIIKKGMTTLIRN